jgi:hypothetical protein
MVNSKTSVIFHILSQKLYYNAININIFAIERDFSIGYTLDVKVV